MPPKKASAPSKKTEQKKKEKVVEDKTFGLKNKKGAKQQKFIQQVVKQVHTGNQPARKTEAEKKKVVEEDPLAIFKPVAAAQKVEKGIDPKSVLCAFFKQGNCGKKDKCKFSHDLSIERKSEKRSLYCDERGDDDKAADTMDQWDEDKLKEVVEKKHGEKDRSRPKTDIICKYFLEAVEKSKYGWFWECPNGDSCHYKHALPPGFQLKKDKKKDEKKDEISLEDLIEKERASLGSNLTPVTLDTFIAWKKRKINEKKAALREEEDKKKADFKAGKHYGLSGRDMFTFNPEMATDGDQLEDGDSAFDTREYQNSETEEDVDYKEVDFGDIDMDYQQDTSEATTKKLSELSLSNGGPSSSKALDTDIPIEEDLFDDSDLPDSDED